MVQLWEALVEGDRSSPVIWMLQIWDKATRAAGRGDDGRIGQETLQTTKKAGVWSRAGLVLSSIDPSVYFFELSTSSLNSTYLPEIFCLSNYNTHLRPQLSA